MSEFKVGDKVRFVDTNGGAEWDKRRTDRQVGTVTRDDLDWGLIEVDWHDGVGYRDGVGASGADQLEHVIKIVNETKLPSFLVAVTPEPTIVYPFQADGRYVKDAQGGEVFYVSGENTSPEQDEVLAQFFVDAINEKIERDK